jgi:hypothetical protein
MLDIATLLGGDGQPEKDNRKVDLSGRPIPKNVRVILNSGVELQCEVVYDGMSRNDPNLRRFLIIAEIDWFKYWIKTIVVGENPEDVELIIPLPKTDPGEQTTTPYMYTTLGQYRMETIVEKRIPIRDD